ncbi:MAG: alkaline phosphatase family protein, partial [Pirellulales bacterium]
MASTSQTKVVLIGLDCAEPTLVFDRYRDKLPNLSRLAADGIWGELRSCDPPITVPAWMSMMSSKDPGTLGFTGFRNRADYSYDKLSIVSSRSVREPLLWDMLGEAGKRVIVLGVPQTYPPRPVSGVLVSGFLTPSLKSEYTYPAELKGEIAETVGPYLFDIPDFRTDEKPRLRRDLWRMTEQRFELAHHLLRTRPWDFFMMVEMGTDRVHHGFWRHMDPAHPKYVPGNEWEDVIEQHYIHVDAQIGRLLDELPDDTTVLVVSDHGATALQGGICVNEWLIQQGYLVLQEYPAEVTRPAELKIDWPKTRAWGEGGYYGRVF